MIGLFVLWRKIIIPIVQRLPDSYSGTIQAISRRGWLATPWGKIARPA